MGFQGLGMKGFRVKGLVLNVQGPVKLEDAADT